MNTSHPLWGDVVVQFFPLRFLFFHWLFLFINKSKIWAMIIVHVFLYFWELNTHYWWCNNYLSNEEIFRNLASFQNDQIWSPSPSIQNQFHQSCVSDRNICTRIHLITWNITVMITQWGQQVFVKSHLNFCVQYDFKHLVISGLLILFKRL